MNARAREIPEASALLREEAAHVLRRWKAPLCPDQVSCLLGFSLDGARVEWQVDGNFTFCLLWVGLRTFVGVAKRNPALVFEYRVNGRWTRNPGPLKIFEANIHGRVCRVQMDPDNPALARRLSLYRAIRNAVTAIQMPSHSQGSGGGANVWPVTAMEVAP